MKLLIYSTKDFEVNYLLEANHDKHKITFTDEVLDSETAMKAIGYNTVSLFSSDHASNNVLEKLKDFGVKYVTLRSVGHDNINLYTAKSLGIKVANVPNYSPYAIAEHAMGLLFALNRKLMVSSQRSKSFNFDINNLIGFDLYNKTVGVIGTGRIGSVVVNNFSGFGCKLLGFDIKENPELKKKFNLRYCSLEELCKESDIITIHVPLNAETHHLIDENLIKLMKKEVIIINTARGAVIYTKHLLNAIENNQIGAFGMDVYEFEKNIFFKDLSSDIPNDELLIKLLARPNVLLTAHHAFLTKEALTNIAETTIYNLDCWSEGKETENELTKHLT